MSCQTTRFASEEEQLSALFGRITAARVSAEELRDGPSLSVYR